MGLLDGQRRTGCASCLRFVCAAGALLLGVPLLLVGIWASRLRERFTPIFQDIVCASEPPHVKRVWFDHGLVGLHIQLSFQTQCTNPNSYDVRVSSDNPWQVYMGKDWTRVASVVKVPEASLPAHGQGPIEADIVVTPTADVFGSIAELLAAGQIPVYLENNIDLHIDAFTLLGSFSTSRSFNKACGMNLRLVGMFRAQAGPMMCRSSFAQLGDLPAYNAADDQRHPGEMRFAPEGEERMELARAEDLRDRYTGIAMGFGYGLGSLLVVCGSMGLIRRCLRPANDCPDLPGPSAAVAPAPGGNPNLLTSTVAPAHGDSVKTPAATVASATGGNPTTVQVSTASEVPAEV